MAFNPTYFTITKSDLHPVSFYIKHILNFTSTNIVVTTSFVNYFPLF